ncbi:MAG: tetratricopeptide repeat protein [Candidatus Omnitrophota bacterium]|jgi:tetratricopeptide (TPR) repeat protein
MFDSHKKIYLYLLILFAVGITVYSNTFEGKFVWDDAFLIVKNYFIKDWHNLTKIFTSELRVFSHEPSNYYRPLQAFSYLADYSFWKLDPFGYHLTNIMLHILASILIFALMKLIAKNNEIALLTGLLFLVHPVHTEVTSYISGRADSLAAVFLLASFILYIKHGIAALGKVKSKLYFLFSVLFFIFALLAKEAALVYPFILLFYNYAIRQERRIAAYRGQVVFFLLLIFYAVLRLTSLNFLRTHGLSFFPASSAFFYRLISSGKIIFFYIKLLFFPVNLHLLRTGIEVKRLFSPEAFLSVLFLIILAGGIFLSYRRSKRVFFYYIWFLLFLLPTLNLFPIGVSVSEHFLYLPSIGFFAIISTGIDSFVRSGRPKKIIALTAAGAVLLTLAMLTYNQNKAWKDNASLYSHLLKFNPESYVLRNNLGSEYLNQGLYGQAEKEFKFAIKINPAYAYPYNNLGNLYLLTQRTEEAVAFYKKAAELRPDLAEPRNNLGRAYLKTGRSQEAIREFNLGLEINPRDPQAYYNLGVANYNLGKKQAAVDYYKKAIEIDTTYIPAYYNLGMVFYQDGDFSGAEQWWQKALTLSPNDKIIQSALSSLPLNNRKGNLSK